jgi:hypothetical protein
MSKLTCKKCYHDCHCDGDLHADAYGVCTCETCKCGGGSEGMVIDDTEECESCQ